MSVTAAPGRLVSRVPPLLRETAFRRYWSAQSISLAGDQISSIALPLAAVLALHASPAEMGYLSALIWLPSLLFALHAGAWVDRRGHRRATMIAADLGRAALLASIPVCSALGVLTLAQLFAVAFAAGTLSIFFAVPDAGVFASLEPSDRYVEGNTLIYQSRALAAVAGPSVGGLLVEALTAPFALAADALSSLGSAFFLGRIRPAEPAPAQDGRRGALSAGARFILTSPVLLIPLAGGPRPLILVMLFTAEFVAGFGVMILDISIGTIVAAVVPDPLRARVSGAFQAINYGTRPVGSLVGGAAGTVLGPHRALWIAAAGGTLGFLCLPPSPMPRFRLHEP